MTIKINGLLIALLILFTGKAQTDRGCGTHPAPAYLLQEMGTAGRSVATFTVPVVFHVYYDNSTVPLPAGYEDVNDALDTLNMRFAKQNADTALIYSGFKNLAAEAQIRFELARKDESGNCISGIFYHYTPNPYIVSLAPNLNTNMYMNVHVVFTAGQFAGFAYYPTLWSSTPDPGNHIVIIASSLRYDVLTHEAGHWLNLIHTFGSVNQTGVCGDDQVADTPETPGSPTCDTLQSICFPPAIENVNNYMDYSDCRAMFTQGQVNRMHATLLDQNLSRRELSTPANLGATGISPIPSCTFTCNPIVYQDLTTSCTFSSKFRFIANPYHVTPDSLKWIFPNGIPATSVRSVEQAQFTVAGATTVTLNTWYQGVQYTYTTTVNPVLTTSTGLTNIAAIPFTQDFENGFTLPHNTLYVTAADTSWEVEDNGYGSDSSVFVHSEHKLQNDTNTFTFGTFNLSGLAHPQLSFKVATSHNSNTVRRKLFIYLRNRCENTERLVSIQYDSVMAGSNTSTGFVPVSNLQWKNISVNLSFVSTDSLRNEYEFRFELIKYFSGNKTDENFYIDDLNLFDTVIGSPPVAAFSIENIHFCPSGCYELECVDHSSGAPYSYSWGTFGGYPNNPVARGCYNLPTSDTVLIYLTVWNEHGSSTTTMPVYIHTIFMDSISVTPSPACEGDTVTMQFHSAHAQPNGETYLWTNNATPSNPYATLLDSSGAMVQAVPGVNASYQVSVQNSFGCTGAFNKSFSLHPAPFVIVSQDKSCIGQGGSATLSAAFAGNYTYSWQPAATLNTATGDSVIASPAATTNYTVTVSDGTCSKDGQIQLNVSVNFPSVSIATTDSVLCAGDSTTLFVSSNVPVTSTWMRNPCCSGTFLANADSVVCSFPGTTTVTVTSTDTNGCAASDTIVVANSGNPNFWVYPYSNAYMGGYQIILCSSADSVCLFAKGAGNYSYTWNDPNGFVSFTGVNNEFATAHLPNYMLANFLVTATDVNGCTTTQQRVIDHQYQGNYPALTISPSSLSICQNASANVYLSPSTSNYYYWMPQTGLSGIISLPLSAGNVGNGWSATVTGTNITSYTVTAIEVNYGCVKSKVLDVNLSAAPFVSLGADTVICIGDTLSLDAGNPGSSYLWNTGVVTQGIDVSSSGNYDVAVTAANGCVGYDTISVTADLCLDAMQSGTGGSDFTIIFGESEDAYSITLENEHMMLVSLYDLTGRKIFSERVARNPFLLNKSALSDGIYLLAVEVDGKRVVRKIILRS